MKILLFGIVKDIIGQSEIDFEISGSKTIYDLKKNLFIKYPKLNDINKFAFAVNEEYVTDDVIIQDNDVVAIIPPVSGG